MPTSLQRQLKKLPDTQGIYLFSDKNGELLYVGKATSLKNRVRSYWVGKKIPKSLLASGQAPRPIEEMLHEVADIKWKETDSALEAIILEAQYIKKFQPKYNVLGKDDKSWNYIVITKDEYPRVETIRQHELNNVRTTKVTKLRNTKIEKKQYDNGTMEQFSHVFGPYPGLNTQATMKLLRRLFQFSTCQPLKKRVGRKDPSSPDRNRVIQDDRKKPCLYRQMGQCLGVCTGEISPVEYKRKVIRPLVTFLRGGKKQLVKTLEREMRMASKAEDFEEAARLRNQIAALRRIHDVALLNKSFFELSGTYPVPRTTYHMREGQKMVRDTWYVERVEGYDISNLGPTGKVGSMVVFVNGEPDKNQYRRFKIRTVEGQSDVDCLEEVIRRRLRHAPQIRNQKSEIRNRNVWPLPDVFLIDGGKPQVNRVKNVLNEQGIMIPVVGIAKGPERKRNDFVFANHTNKKEDDTNREFIRWVAANKALLIRVRDEAHRFAVGYQRRLRMVY
ncbi:MAG: hypothetical protein A3C90_04105 [Candidatus Magasanikbacteria bacterium RIFCSPHIGHO2_02_FULL_51_14]|uniref:Excinuclease ABC subunit C n=1 Tax=Candidatus Magasanikbacteria bacterium RIFCSPHIGHO2_02_FULL_51_14 TaxID=1798683 RepID=A0A1F6MGD3_9BACT|nr:MAG: hypothetical protein A3C90_04105 [Candidatus Magasanikbacteria bacterium RIFCSPHIGHO2_02_FULL_51_14]